MIYIVTVLIVHMQTRRDTGDEGHFELEKLEKEMMEARKEKVSLNYLVASHINTDNRMLRIQKHTHNIEYLCNLNLALFTSVHFSTAVLRKILLL